MSDEAHAHEIVIIKRHGAHEEGHHGGVWKIAFADFMTAMMAFFLVMWLVSANDKTKAVIAKYFNPVELVDSTPQPPGLNDSKKGDPSVQRESKRPATDAQGKEKNDPKGDGGPAGTGKALEDTASKTVHDEAELARDPYAVLSEIATQTKHEPPEQTKKPPVEEARRGTGAQGRQGGEAFRDPFEPNQPTAPAAAVPADPAADAATADAAAPPPPPPAPPAAPAEAPPASASLAAAPGSEAAAAPAAPDDKPVSPATLRARLAALGKPADGSPDKAPKLDVRATPEGLLISLTDSAGFSMFPSASARPDAKTVALVEKIGQLLKTQKGNLTVRGFTDSRPFKSDTYDNWRLSTARAHMAHYMLVQGGVSDSRIDHVEGYADRKPKNPKNSEAAENRRIEILLRDPTP